MRTDDADLTARLREVLAAHVVPDVEAPPNLSLSVGADEGRVRALHTLYRGSRTALRTRSLHRLLVATLLHLDAFAGDPPDIRRVDARLLVRPGGGAVVVDGWLAYTLDRVERRLERLGYQVVDTPGVPLDSLSLDVSLGAPRLDIDRPALAAVGTGDQGDHEIALRAGHLPLDALVVGGDDRDSETPPARQLAAMTASLAYGREEFARDDLDLARRLLRQRTVLVAPVDTKPLLDVMRHIQS